MASESPRWRNIREFLDDLPTEHCRAKPDHEFCTVCLRINYLIAQDCPLYHQKPKRKKRAASASPPEARPEPIKDHLSASDVKQALKGEDFPIIEFAGPRGTGGHPKDEGVFEVKPIDVKPIASPPPEAIKKPPKKEEPDEVPEEDEAKPAKPATAVADRDPESIVQEIMEELEFPDDMPSDDDDEPEEAELPEEGQEGPEGDEEEADEAKASPPVVKKEAVTKRRPKDK